jgi:hypothetical protein
LDVLFQFRIICYGLGDSRSSRDREIEIAPFAEGIFGKCKK